MSGNRLTKLSLAIGLSVTTTAALASPQAFMSSRSFAMGGTGVAVAHPAAAGMSNPAMLAADHHQWSDDFGLMLPSVNARMADEEETIDQIDDIQDTIDRFEDLDRGSNPAEAQNAAAELRRQLNEFDRDTVRTDVGLGLAVAIPTDSYSVGFFTSANLQATVRGEFDEDDDAFLAALENADAATLEAADLDVLDHHIAPGGQVAHQLLPFRRGDVDGDRALVAVGAQVVGRLAGRLTASIGQVGRPPVAGVVADAGALDLDDLSPQISQELAGPRPRQDAGQVQHAKV